MKVNYVTSKDLGSKIFADMFRMFKEHCYNYGHELIISEKAVNDCDIYHFHRPHMEDSLPENSVVTVHHDILETDGWLIFEQFEPIYKQANLIICLNSIQRDYLNTRGLYHTVVIPHGFNDSIFTEELRNKRNIGKINIGICSKSYHRRFKGEAYIHDLATQLDPGNIQFTLIGEGRSSDYDSLKSLGFEVLCYDSIPYILYGSVYNSLDIMLMVSNYEGGPASLPEALASGTPVFTTDVGMSRDLVEDNVSGIFLTGDISLDIKKIQKNLNRETITRLGKNATNSKKLITWSEVFNKQILHYKNILDSKQQFDNWPKSSWHDDVNAIYKIGNKLKHEIEENEITSNIPRPNKNKKLKTSSLRRLRPSSKIAIKSMLYIFTLRSNTKVREKARNHPERFLKESNNSVYRKLYNTFTS